MICKTVTAMDAEVIQSHFTSDNLGNAWVDTQEFLSSNSVEKNLVGTEVNNVKQTGEALEKTVISETRTCLLKYSYYRLSQYLGCSDCSCYGEYFETIICHC